ncbi:hypothetical protein D3C78_1693710 [compost metagenome]
MATVPCPAITSGSSKGETNSRPVCSARSSACARANGKLSPCRIASAPRLRTPSTFNCTVVTGMTMLAEIPNSRAASATPWA